jgi:tetratricopeptide (TPR) repeat protein
MSQWMQWMLLSWITGSPIGALLVLAVIWWLGDRATFRVLPDPFRLFKRWGRTARLRRDLAANPHDRRARLELAQILLDLGRPRQAAEVLRPNLEAGDDDVHTAFAMGAALARSGSHEPAERCLAIARERDPAFRMGEIDLEVGRMRMKRGDSAGAVEPLTRLVAERPGTVEGRFWLARALEGQGDAAGAARVRDDAWREYAALPRFRRQQERPYAWRMRPWRPALVAVAVALATALVLREVLPALSAARSSPANAPGEVAR